MPKLSLIIDNLKFMNNKTSYISYGDLIDLFFKVKEKGYNELLSKFHPSNQARTVSKWNTNASSSDFWIIPEIRSNWNIKCTGNSSIGYEDYFVSKFLSDTQGLKMLSVGCGTGSRERNFGNYSNFNMIEGIDIAKKKIDEARQHANDLRLDNVKYIVGDFMKHDFKPNSYDVLLFNSSLHHFNDIDNLLHTKILPLLKTGGFLVIFEYVGPNRLQWTNSQLALANKLLKELPKKYKIRFKSKSIKNRIYRPGLLRMVLVDPSEAVDSESIIPAIHKYFQIIEEKKIGCNISHLLFKDIAHNFLNNDDETQSLLSYLLKKEDEYLTATGLSDSVFGVYQK